MKILWMTWKDLNHPQAGGAELINEEIAKRLAKGGHEVILLTSNFEGGKAKEERDGYKIVRVGSRYTVYWHAYRFYKKNFVGWADFVIDEMNTIPFFCKLYVQERNVLLAYQLCREIWFYQIKFPLSLIGYLLEPLYLRLLRDRQVLTESESTKKDMQRYGFTQENIQVFSVGISTQPIQTLNGIAKYSKPTLLSLGSIRAMKRTLDQIVAFELAKKNIPNLQLIIAGSFIGAYGESVRRRIAESEYSQDITYLGIVSEHQKTEVMKRSHFILVTSVKEGWGLIVTEANSQGTPAIVYDVDGLRDSVKQGETGLISSKNTPKALAAAITEGLRNENEYERLRETALQWSRQLTLDRCYSEFTKILFAIR